MKKIYLLFFFLLLFFQAAISQITVNLPAEADNTIYQDNTGNSNGEGANFTAGATGTGSPRRALIKFNIAGSVPSGAVITSVTLTLRLNKTKPSTDIVSLYKLNANWGEGTSDAGDPDGGGAAARLGDATWVCGFSDGAGGCSTSWTVAGGDFNASASASISIPSVITTYNWNSAQMATDVQNWVNTPSSNFGWIIRSDETTTRTVNRFDSRQGITPPVLSITYNNPIPVTLTSFKAQETKSGILLNWETAQEFNNAFFSIEHSRDGLHFSSIGKVNGHGTTALPHVYSFKHEGINAGQQYYRLAQNDINGRINYSSIVAVNSKNKLTVLQVSPNPVVNKIILQGSSGKVGNIYTITNQTGATVLSGVLKTNTIEVQSIAKGNYFIRLQQADGTVLSGQFLKQ